MQFNLVNDEELVFSVLDVSECSARSVSRPVAFGVSQHCITVLSMTWRLFGNHWVSVSLEGATHALLRLLVVLLSLQDVFMWPSFSRLPTLPPFFQQSLSTQQVLYCPSNSVQWVLGLGSLLDCKQDRLLAVLATWGSGQQFKSL